MIGQRHLRRRGVAQFGLGGQRADPRRRFDVAGRQTAFQQLDAAVQVKLVSGGTEKNTTNPRLISIVSIYKSHLFIRARSENKLENNQRKLRNDHHGTSCHIGIMQWIYRSMIDGKLANRKLQIC